MPQSRLLPRLNKARRPLKLHCVPQPVQHAMVSTHICTGAHDRHIHKPFSFAQRMHGRTNTCILRCKHIILRTCANYCHLCSNVCVRATGRTVEAYRTCGTASVTAPCTSFKSTLKQIIPTHPTTTTVHETAALAIKWHGCEMISKSHVQVWSQLSWACGPFLTTRVCVIRPEQASVDHCIWPSSGLHCSRRKSRRECLKRTLSRCRRTLPKVSVLVCEHVCVRFMFACEYLKGHLCTCMLSKYVHVSACSCLYRTRSRYGVDIYFAGHKHSYERSLPVFANHVHGTYADPMAPTYIISGAAGEFPLPSRYFDSACFMPVHCW